MKYDDIWHRLKAIYEEGEAKAIARYVLDVRFGMSATDIYCGKVTQLSAEDTEELEKIINRLKKSEPVQYILGTADFVGRTFKVAPGVLIPRPETAELCDWIVNDNAVNKVMKEVLDIGSGSGCIAITLSLDLLSTDVHAWDISSEALKIASENAGILGATVSFEIKDAITPPEDNGKWDIIVSNPPYICDMEKADMDKNVLEYEPGLALFVPDKDPLLFYRSISEYAINALKPAGAIYFEINPLYNNETKDMMSSIGFENIEEREDMFGKPRFIKARR